MTSLVSALTLGFSSPAPFPKEKNTWCWTWRLRNPPIRKPWSFLGQDWPRLIEVTQRRRDENGTTANEQATQRKAGPRWTWLEAWPLLWCYIWGLHFKQDLNDILEAWGLLFVTLNEILPMKHQHQSKGHTLVKPRHLPFFGQVHLHECIGGDLVSHSGGAFRHMAAGWSPIVTHGFPVKGMVIKPIVGIFKEPMKKDISWLFFF